MATFVPYVYDHLIMKNFNLISPSGLRFTINAETIYHAVSKLVYQEKFKYSNIDYLKLNKHGKN